MIDAITDQNEQARHATYQVLPVFEEQTPDAIVNDLKGKLAEAIKDYPELAGKTVTVGTMAPRDRGEYTGMATHWNDMVAFLTDQKTSWQTVYHELAHLAIYELNDNGVDVPHTSEEFCSIFAVARMSPGQLYRNDISYLGEPSAPKDEWPEICQRALEYRENNRNYIQKCKEWLQI